MYDPAAPWPGIGRRSAGYDFGFDRETLVFVPTTLREVTAAAGDTVSLHAEDIRYIPVACGGAYPVINAAAGISGTGAANATLVSARLVKLA